MEDRVGKGPRADRRITRSTVLGAGLGAAAMLGFVALALWLSGLSETLSADRGLLQLVVVMPASALAAGAALSRAGWLDTRQLLWASVLVAFLLGLGGYLIGDGAETLVWTMAIGVALLPPWAAGVWLGGAIRRRSE